MIIEIKVPDSAARLFPAIFFTDLGMFLQRFTNRIIQGGIRYGIYPKRRQRYFSRLKMETRYYDKTGNFENLINTAVYCHLESQAPENRKFHFDPNEPSVTRGVFGV